MSEMVERVVEALKGFDLDGASGRYEEELRKASRAAIEAMREPNEAMETAMRRAFERQENVWSAAIDEALK